jgi:ATP synthase protein I
LCARLSRGGAGFYGFLATLAEQAQLSDGDGNPDQSSAEEKALSGRLRDLDRRLDENRATRAQASRPDVGPPRQGYALAMRLGTDFVAGIVVGAAIGWGVDRLFGTSPWGLMVFLLLGFGAGLLSVLRSAGLVKPGPPGPDDRVK